MNDHLHPALGPGNPGTVVELAPQGLAHWPAGVEPPLIVDVREPWELALCALPASLCIPLGEFGARLSELSRERDIVLVCHHGVRSRMAARVLLAQGYARVFNLSGGIDAWSVAVDPALPRY